MEIDGHGKETRLRTDPKPLMPPQLVPDRSYPGWATGQRPCRLKSKIRLVEEVEKPGAIRRPSCSLLLLLPPLPFSSSSFRVEVIDLTTNELSGVAGKVHAQEDALLEYACDHTFLFAFSEGKGDSITDFQISRRHRFLHLFVVRGANSLQNPCYAGRSIPSRDARPSRTRRHGTQTTGRSMARETRTFCSTTEGGMQGTAKRRFTCLDLLPKKNIV